MESELTYLFSVNNYKIGEKIRYGSDPLATSLEEAVGLYETALRYRKIPLAIMVVENYIVVNKYDYKTAKRILNIQKL